MCDDNECEFRILEQSDVTKSYVKGLRAQRKYLFFNTSDVCKESQQKYISNIIRSKKDTICGLFVKNKLMGTAGIQNVSINTVPTIGIFIFDVTWRGKGYGKNLVWAICFLVTSCHNIVQFSADMRKDNIHSLKSFLACGFNIVKNNEEIFLVELNIKNLIKPINVSGVQIVNLTE